MNIQRFLAPTAREALAKARLVFGDGTLILSNRSTSEGVEVMATAEDTLSHMDQGVRNSAPLMAAIQSRDAEETRPPKSAPKVLQAAAQQSVEADTEQLAMSTLSFQDYVRERMLRRRAEGVETAEPAMAELPSFARRNRSLDKPTPAAAAPVLRHNPLRGMALDLPQEPRQSARQEAAAPAMATQGVMNELQSMKDLIEERFNTLTWLGQARQNPIHSNLMLKLIRAGYSPALSRAMLERMPVDASPAEAMRWLMNVLERNLHTDAQQMPLHETGGIYALVGSTGVGKTTTTAKLAALCAQQYGAASVGLITLDTYRVGAHEQLRAYGRMLGVVAHLAHDRVALQDLLGLLSGKKMVLIDTTGVAPRDPRKDEILEMLNLPQVQRLLVLNAGCHGDTLDESLAAFKSDGSRQTILSKVDEAVKLGPALDALIRHQMVLRGITNGQRVPEDWERANANELIATSMRAQVKSAFDPKALDLDFFFSGQGSARQDLLHA